MTEILIGDTVEMKKCHPCGSKLFSVLRTGADIKLKCSVCGRELMLPRLKAEKAVKRIIKKEKQENL